MDETERITATDSYLMKRFVVFFLATSLIAIGTLLWVSPDVSPNLDTPKWSVFLGGALFFISFLLSLFLTPLMIRLSLALQFVDAPKGRKSHERVTPLGGGIPIFCAVNLILGGGLAFFWMVQEGWIPSQLHFLPIDLTKHQFGVREQSPLLLNIMGGGFLLFLTGLFDDRKGLSARYKFLVQIVVALGFLIHFFSLESKEPIVRLLSQYWWLSGPILVLWIVGITNAFNLLDNMDGLSSGVVFIVALNLLMVCLNTKQIFVGALLLVLMGANLGFLLFNFSPAKIFMGDCGSLFMGYLISVSVILCFTAQEGGFFYPLVVPVMILAVPLYDTFSVICIRLRAGYSIFRADNNHFSHRLVTLGFSRPNAVCFIYLVTFTTGITSTLLDRLDLRGGILITLQILCTLIIIALLESIAIKKSKE